LRSEFPARQFAEAVRTAKPRRQASGALRTRWLAFYGERVEPVSREIFGHVEKMIIGTLMVSAGAHVSSSEPAIVLFGYLRHGLIGRGVELFGVILLVLISSTASPSWPGWTGMSPTRS
jgi:hypothetical protein